MKQKHVMNELRLIELMSSIAAVAVALLFIFVLVVPQSRERTMAARISGGNIVRQVSFSLPSLSTPSQPDGPFKRPVGERD